MITFENISKKYKEVDALKNISFEIKEGEIFGYIGPNGAGKTTTIKIMVGLINDFVDVSISTVLVGIILIVLTHNIASLSIIRPLMAEYANPILRSSITGIFLTIVFLTTAMWIFNRRQF